MQREPGPSMPRRGDAAGESTVDFFENNNSINTRSHRSLRTEDAGVQLTEDQNIMFHGFFIFPIALNRADLKD